MFGLLRYRPTFTLKGRTPLGLRGWDGIPLHPHSVHFPIAGYLLAAVFDLVSLLSQGRPWSRDAFVAATWVMLAGAVLSLWTALTGFLEWRFTPRGSHRHDHVIPSSPPAGPSRSLLDPDSALLAAPGSQRPQHLSAHRGDSHGRPSSSPATPERPRFVSLL